MKVCINYLIKKYKYKIENIYNTVIKYNIYYFLNKYCYSKKTINNPSKFALFIYENYINNNDEIIDLGSENCKDSLYFATKGNYVKVIDSNPNCYITHDNLKIIKKDIDVFLTYNMLNNNSSYIYIKWLLHKLPYHKSEKIFALASTKLKKNGLIFIEVRSIHDRILIEKSTYDNTDQSYSTLHKRWLYNKQLFDYFSTKYNCKIIYYKEGFFLENENKNNNPLLIRVIFSKM
tara:strand:+ start:5260 stop:5958 length:699 start_codon:yes stop_codon:yes gene_type:complete